MPTRELIEPILARLLLEPTFLAAMRADAAAALRDYPADDRLLAELAGTDLERIRLFSGFIGKVQHNDLWDLFPASRHLLRYHGLELEAFAEYRRIQLSASRDASDRAARIRSFLDFLEPYVAVRKPPALAEVLRHERALWEVRTAMEDSADARALDASGSALPWRDMLARVPRVLGPLRIHPFPCDPARLAAAVCAGRYHGRAPRRRSQILAYWGDRHTARLRVLRLDALTAMVLSQTDGRRTMRAVIGAARRRGLSEAPPRAFRPFFADAVRCGLIHLDAGSR